MFLKKGREIIYNIYENLVYCFLIYGVWRCYVVLIIKEEWRSWIDFLGFIEKVWGKLLLFRGNRWGKIRELWCIGVED